MRRCSALKLQPLSTNFAASQSSSSGWVGFLPVLPKLFGFPASGWPKCHIHTRFTMALVVSGLSALATHSAKALRRPSMASGIGVFCAAPSTLRTPGFTLVPEAKGSPPVRMQVSSSSPALILSGGMRSGAKTVLYCRVRPP